MLLAPDDRDAPLVVLVPPGRTLSSELPEGLRGAVVVELDGEGARLRGPGGVLSGEAWTSGDGWRLKLGESGEPSEQTILDRTDWGSPEIRVTPAGEERATLRCRLPTGEDEELVVGRSSRRSHLALEDEAVSRRHLRFFLQDGRPVVEDLESSGGTFVNGERIQGPTALHHQDTVRLGNTTIEYYAYLEALDDLPELEEVSSGVRTDSWRARESAREAPAPEPAASTAPSAPAGRPMLDTIMYSMAILTVLVALVVAWKFLL